MIVQSALKTMETEASPYYQAPREQAHPRQVAFSNSHLQFVFLQTQFSALITDSPITSKHFLKINITFFYY